MPSPTVKAVSAGLGVSSAPGTVWPAFPPLTPGPTNLLTSGNHQFPAADPFLVIALQAGVLAFVFDLHAFPSWPQPASNLASCLAASPHPFPGHMMLIQAPALEHAALFTWSTISFLWSTNSYSSCKSRFKYALL